MQFTDAKDDIQIYELINKENIIQLDTQNKITTTKYFGEVINNQNNEGDPISDIANDLFNNLDNLISEK